MISPSATVVVVKSDVVVLLTTVPELIATPDVLMLLDTVGIAVPAAIFHTLMVHVPVSTMIVQAVIVPPLGTFTYWVKPLTIVDPAPSNDAPNPRASCTPEPPADTQTLPLQRQVDRDEPPPTAAPGNRASVNTYTEPVAGEPGGDAKVVVGGIQPAALALMKPVSTAFCFT
jgi:hypothetical protein